MVGYGAVPVRLAVDSTGLKAQRLGLGSGTNGRSEGDLSSSM